MDATKDTDAKTVVSATLTDRNCYVGESDSNRRALERRLVRKLDMVILPVLCMSFPYPNSVDIDIPTYFSL
jgi:hypothetical protein